MASYRMPGRQIGECFQNNIVSYPVIARSKATKQSDPKDRHEQSEVISLLNGDCFSRMLRARNGFAGLLRYRSQWQIGLKTMQ